MVFVLREISMARTWNASLLLRVSRGNQVLHGRVIMADIHAFNDAAKRHKGVSYG